MNTIKINMNEILEREQTYDKIKLILKEFQENKKDIKKAIELVAEKLHNTYSICKKSYIDPEIIANAEKQIK